MGEKKEMVEIKWESVMERPGGGSNLVRAKVPGGWLVSSSQGLTFIPDPKHEWK
jgi:hypothetical protein